MTDNHPSHDSASLSAAPESLGASRNLFRARHFVRRGRLRWGRVRRSAYRLIRRRWFGRLAWTLGSGISVTALVLLGLWWRLASGPIELNLATPWLASAIADNFGSKHTVTVGGTQLERDENGRTALRMRDIIVRDAEGVVVASAPKAEVGLSGSSLLSGRVRAESLNLVGAEMAVRIETDGNITVFAGANSRPIATAPASALPVHPVGESAAPGGALRSSLEDFGGLLAWFDGLGATGLDGHDLRELGLKNGNLTVDDQRNGKHWTFSNINVSLTRPPQGGVIFRLASETPERPWQLSAALRPLSGGLRAVGIEARKVSATDLLLALRFGEGAVESDLPLSASLRGEFAADGSLQGARGQIVAEAGFIRDPQNVSAGLAIEHADIRFTWDGKRRSLVVPFQIQGGGTQVTLVARTEPADQDGLWTLDVMRGDPVIDPVIFSPGNEPGEEGFALNRVNIRARFDLVRQRVDLDQADIGRNDVRPAYNVGVAVSGSYDYAGAEPRVTFGVAGTRMPVTVMKRLWPMFIATPVRSWVEGHINSGTVERVLVAGNVLLPVLTDSRLPIPDEGLSVDVETSGTTLRPIGNMPPIRDADLIVHVTGRTANVALGRGTIEVASGRRLSIASGSFDVPDTHPDAAPALARFRIDGSVPAAATLLATDALRDVAGIVLDPATSRGTLSAQTMLNLILTRDHGAPSPNYAVTIDLSNFTADRVLMGQKIEAQSLRVIANSAGYQVKGDVKINGISGALDFRKAASEVESDLNLQTTLDDAGRRKLGIDFGPSVTGSVPVKVTGRVGPDDKTNRVNVDADFTPAKIDNLLPGWVKPAGKPAHATFAMTKDAKSTRFDDLTIDGQGTLAKGSVELDAVGDIVSANFPVFGLSEGDRTTLKVDRGVDGVLRVVMRGDVYDGRSFVKSSLGNAAPAKIKPHQVDADLDVRIGVVLGHNGEAVRGLDFKLSRRSGHIRSFTLSAKIGRDTALIGDIRPRSGDKVQVLYLETDDAGSLFRFTDTYPRIFGGQMWLAMDPPTQENTSQLGQLNIRNFSVRGEPALERVVAGASNNTAKSAVEFSEMRADFTRQPGRMLIRDGVLRGPLVGATIDGQIDYARDEIRMRGTFVPLYAINNMFGRIPIVGIFLGGGSNEGLLGITYEAVGPPSAPRISVNPISAVAPGLLRKLIPGPGMFDPNAPFPPVR
jgi:hypothetical protein